MPKFWAGPAWGTTHPPEPHPIPLPRWKGHHFAPFSNRHPSAFQIGIHLPKTWNWSVVELWGKNWDTDAHAHATYQAPITGLHSPTLNPFLQNSTDYLMLAEFWKFGVNCCFIGLTNSAACTRARVPLTFGHVHKPLLFTQFAQKGCQSTGLGLRIPLISLKFCRSVPEIFWRGGPKNSIPQNFRFCPRLPPWLDSYIYKSKAHDVRISNI